MTDFERGYRVSKVGVTYGRKVNLGDYNSANIEYSVWVDIDSDPDAPADLDAINRELWEMAKANVKQQAAPLLKKAGATVERMFLGVPIVDAASEDQKES